MNVWPDELTGAEYRPTTPHSPPEATESADKGWAGVVAYMEEWARVFDTFIFPGMGDVLRDFYRDLKRDAERRPACLSGAADELEFYGGAE